MGKTSKSCLLAAAAVLFASLLIWFLTSNSARVNTKETLVFVPEGYDGQKELPVVVWLHGGGGRPSNAEPFFNRWVNKLQLIFIGVSGPISIAERRYNWADDAAEDYQRVRLALDEARKSIRFRDGSLVALGFSQGAMVAVEVAVRHPEIFAGAITVSAGTGSPLQFKAVSDKTALPRQAFVIVCGAKEVPWSVERSNDIANWLRDNKARVLQPAYPDHSEHSFPSDFAERLPEWLAFIAKAHEGRD